MRRSVLLLSSSWLALLSIKNKAIASFICSILMWEWYWFSHLNLYNNVIKPISQTGISLRFTKQFVKTATYQLHADFYMYVVFFLSHWTVHGKTWANIAWGGFLPVSLTTQGRYPPQTHTSHTLLIHTLDLHTHTQPLLSSLPSSPSLPFLGCSSFFPSEKGG